MSLYPLTFTPVFRDYLWGGRSLETLYHRVLPPGVVAESWEISGHLSSSTCVDEGPWRGRSLFDITAEYGPVLVGSRDGGGSKRGQFPLLIKLLDAHQDLSVQVHPDDAYAMLHENGESGKSEMWYILHAQPGAEIIYGLAPGTTRQMLQAALAKGDPGRLLHRVRVRAGDCAYVPAGTVHALLRGVVVAEIQQNSDATYRVYDWERRGLDGKLRPLHVSKALEVIDWQQVTPDLVYPVRRQVMEGVYAATLVHCSHFMAERVELEAGKPFEGSCDGTTFQVWGCLSGAVELTWAGAPRSLEAIRFVLLPATLGDFRITANVASTLLRVTL